MQRMVRDDVSLITNTGHHRLLTDESAKALGCEQPTAGLTGVVESLQPGLTCSDSGKRKRVSYSKRNIIRRKRLCHTHKPCHIFSPPLPDLRQQEGQRQTRDIRESIMVHESFTNNHVNHFADIAQHGSVQLTTFLTRKPGRRVQHTANTYPGTRNFRPPIPFEKTENKEKGREKDVAWLEFSKRVYQISPSYPRNATRAWCETCKYRRDRLNMKARYVNQTVQIVVRLRACSVARLRLRF